MPAEAAHHECSGKSICFIARRHNDFADFTQTKGHVTCLHLVSMCVFNTAMTCVSKSSLAPKWELHLSLDWDCEQENFVWWRSC